MSRTYYAHGDRLALYNELPTELSQLIDDVGYATESYVDTQLTTKITQYTTMPTASESLEDHIVQFIGTTTSTYTNGYFYKCLGDGGNPETYSWEVVNVQDADPAYDYIIDGYNEIDLDTDYNGYVLQTQDIIDELNSINSNYLDANLKVKPLRIALKIEGKTISTSFQIIKDTNNNVLLQFVVNKYSYPQQSGLNKTLKNLIICKDPNHQNYWTLYNINLPDLATVNGKEDKVNKTDNITGTGSSTSYTSTKAVYDFVVSGSQTITGTKTFSTIPVQSNTTAPTLDTQYTNKKYVDDKIAAIQTLKREIVQVLPVQDIDPSTIYMVPKDPSGTNNYYTEYMYINNTWEKIGDTEVDLSNYYTKTEIDEIIGQIEAVLDEIINGSSPSNQQNGS